MISHHRKFIFLHIPKCGGTSVESTFGAWSNNHSENYFYLGNNRQHCLLNEILDEHPECSNYFKFAFIRNPFSRIVSEYNYILSNFKKLKNLSFKEFILNLEYYFKNFAYEYHSLSLCDYLVNKEGEIVVDFVGRLENFQDDFNKVCDNINMPNLTLPHAMKSSNNSNKKHYTEYYNDETREIVAQQYAKDIEYFDYQFQLKKEAEPTLYNQRGELIDVSQTEYYDRKVANTWISENDIVLELGSRFGICSTTINKKLKNKKNHVAVEPDKIAWDILEKNRDLNKCEFQILKGFVSKKKLSLKNIKAWDGYANKSFEDPDSKIRNYSLQEVEGKFNLKFNTLFADCEGFLPTFIEENPQVLDNFYKIIFEADWVKQLPESTYENIGKLLNQKGFSTRLTGHYHVYIKY